MSPTAAREPPLVSKWDSPDATFATARGKAASLARMAAAGFPAPPGFYVTTQAYLCFVEEVDSSQIERLFVDTAMPAAIGSAVRAAYGEIGGEPGGNDVAVAVRSSATAEGFPGGAGVLFYCAYADRSPA